jgi:hypothetical protein
MMHSTPAHARLALAGLLAAGVTLGLAAQTAPAASAAKVRELAGLLKGKQLEAFAARESPVGNRFVAAMLVPDVQMLVVGADYSRPTDIEYFIYQKDYVSAYRSLQSGVLASDRVFVEDVLVDGLVAVPVKNAPPDAVTLGAARQLLVGPADPKKRNDTRMAPDAYAKALAEADRRYAMILDGLIAALKKGTLVPAGHLR